MTTDIPRAEARSSPEPDQDWADRRARLIIAELQFCAERTEKLARLAEYLRLSEREGCLRGLKAARELMR